MTPASRPRRDVTALAIALVGALLLLSSGSLGVMPARAASAPDTDTSGTVTSIGASSLSIRSKKGKTKTFRLEADTAYARLDEDATLADVRVGDVVKVDYAPAANGATKAIEVTIGVSTANGWFFTTHIEGAVDSISSTAVAVKKTGGDTILTLTYKASTPVERIGTKLLGGALGKGDLVLAEFSIQPSGVLDATSVEVGIKASNGTIVYGDKHKGTIVSRNGANVVLDLKGFPPTPFLLDGSSKVERLGRTASPAALASGAVVKVDLTLNAAGALVIRKVNVGAATPYGDLFSTKESGRVVSLAGGVLRLRPTDADPLPFRLAPKAQVLLNGLVVPRSRLKPGTVAKVRFSIVGKVLVASEIKLGVARKGELVFPKRKTGLVIKVTATSIVVRNAKGSDAIRLTARTLFRRGGRPIARGALRPRDRVAVIYDPAGPGTKLALTVFALSR